jgi:hypothetical protein
LKKDKNKEYSTRKRKFPVLACLSQLFNIAQQVQFHLVAGHGTRLKESKKKESEKRKPNRKDREIKKKENKKIAK